MKKLKKRLNRYIIYRDGKIWFTRSAEKKFFFFMTLLMLSLGAAYAIAGL